MAKNNNQINKQKMSYEEAGRKGGETTSQKYSQEHFENIGQKGGSNSGNGSMTNKQYKTGEKAPESGKYKVYQLANRNNTKDNTEINLNEGDQFPPSPSENEAAYWVKSS
ncbi:YjzC family protein [Halobacillus seohaensis]|uniref:YjzC family protein n=1 Tax=Halobacillus seohaensis TaxID=447421 RepID=A0ABW2EQQ1_9BACI